LNATYRERCLFWQDWSCRRSTSRYWS